jgi:hypothetical protein
MHPPQVYRTLLFHLPLFKSVQHRPWDNAWIRRCENRKEMSTWLVEVADWGKALCMKSTSSEPET